MTVASEDSPEAGAGGRAPEMAEKRGETVSEEPAGSLQTCTPEEGKTATAASPCEGEDEKARADTRESTAHPRRRRSKPVGAHWWDMDELLEFTEEMLRGVDEGRTRVIDPESPAASDDLEVIVTEVEKEEKNVYVSFPSAEESADRKRKEAETARKQVEEEDTDHEIRSEDVAHQAWDTLGAERTAQLLEAANRTGQKSLNTSRLNIVGEGRAGKTAWLRGVSNQRFTETDSTIGVQQSLLEVNKVDMKAGGGGDWSVVEDGSSSIMTAEEAEKRLAAELALAETPEERREREKRAHAALVIQQAVRCHAARLTYYMLAGDDLLAELEELEQEFKQEVVLFSPPPSLFY